MQVDATVKQEEAVEWDELHLLEFRHKEEFYTRWATGHPPERRAAARGATHPLTDRNWGALMNADDAMGLVGSQLYGIHDGLGGHGTYVHGPWVGHFTGPATYHGVLYVGPSGERGGSESHAAALRPQRGVPEAAGGRGSLEAAQDRLGPSRPGRAQPT